MSPPFALRSAAAFLTVAAVTLSAQSPSSIAAELRSQLERRVHDVAAHVDGVVGYEVLDLTSNERFGQLERAVFPTASTIKLAIVYELFKQADEGRVKLDDRITLDRAKAVGGSGVLAAMGTPTLSIRDYAALMVMLSDNTATNVLIDLVGAGSVTQRMAGLGLGATKLRRRMMDLEAARRGDENVSTPAEVVRLLQILHTGNGLTPASRDQALDLLKKTKISRLRAGLPPGVEAANKPGELEGVRVDAGIVFAKNRPYALCMMTTYLKSEEEGEHAIVDISRAVYEYFSRLGAGGVYGRREIREAAPNRGA